MTVSAYLVDKSTGQRRSGRTALDGRWVPYPRGFRYCGDLAFKVTRKCHTSDLSMIVDWDGSLLAADVRFTPHKLNAGDLATILDYQIEILDLFEP